LLSSAKNMVAFSEAKVNGKVDCDTLPGERTRFNGVSLVPVSGLDFSDGVPLHDTRAPWGTKEAETAWKRWSRLFGKDLLGIIPPDAETAPHLRKNRGKIPGYRIFDGTWCGRSKPLGGPEADTTREEIKQWAHDYAGIGIMGRTCPGLDNDASNEHIRDGLREIIHRHVGRGPRRGRPNSYRDLHMLLGPGLKSWQIKYRPPGKPRSKDEKPDLLELVARTYYNVEGPHPSGVMYRWENGHPCDCGPDRLPKLDQPTSDKIRADAFAYLKAEGCEIVEGGSSSFSPAVGGSNGRFPIGHEPFLAPSLNVLADALRLRPNTAENVPTHLDFVRVATAIKAACDGDEGFYCDVFEDWALKYPGNDPEYVRKMWDSIRDATIGWGWLADWTGYTARYGAEEAFDEPAPPEYRDDAPPLAPSPVFTIDAKPFTLRDPASIEPRRFLYERHYIRKYLGMTASPGGTGKSSLALAEGVAMATHKNLLGTVSVDALRVLYWNGEDPFDEIERRIAAICKCNEITADHLAGRLFVLSGRDVELCIARMGRGGVEVVKPTVEALRRFILENHIDVVILDPFVALHAVPENDNGAINTICRQLAMLADEGNCAIELVDHTRKGASGEQGERTVDDARGASSKLAAARSARVLNTMTKEEGARSGVRDHREYFRVDNGKANLAPASENSRWYHKVNVPLGNGDDVGVVTPWKWPDLSDGLTPANIRAIQDAIAGGEWRDDIRSGAWAGNAVADALGWDRDTPAAKNKLKSVLQSVKGDGYLRTKSGLDAKGNRRLFVVIGQSFDQTNKSELGVNQ
jgi:hypothetical protein